VPLLAHVRRARDHIDCNYREPLDLDGLARIAGVSKYHFARSFEAAYGETPIGICRMLRPRGRRPIGRTASRL